MATYNGEKFIFDQLSSILQQLGNEDEVIVSDDLSKDRTIEIVKSFNDKRIKIFLNSKNLGFSKNFENALSKARGGIIFIADQDDVWNPDKVIKMQRALEYADMVVSDAEIVDTNLKHLYPSHFVLNGTRRGFLNAFLRNRYVGACMAFKRELLDKALPLPANNKLCAYDCWFAVIGEYFFKVVLINEPLIKYRRHGGNASSGGGVSPNSFIKKIKMRMYMLQQLLKRKINITLNN
ncbi:glycosyltransferase family 2 protein [Pedobacter cryoconitis]|nr:glycosyltransferase family 2 protein [Pedobacter cryoconitis]